MLSRVAFRPGGCERVSALTGHSAPHGKIEIEVFARLCVRAPGQAVLYPAKGFVSNQSFMFALAHQDTPGLIDDHACITLVGQDRPGPGIANPATDLLGKLRGGFEKIPHLSHRLKTSRCKPFQDLHKNGRRRLAPDQDFSMFFRPGVFVANRRDKGMISRLQPGLGLLAGLASNLFEVQLALRRKQSVHELPFRRIVKTVVQTLQPRPEIF